MAYAQGTITRTLFRDGNRQFGILEWDTTEAGAATEDSISGLPQLLTITEWSFTAAASTMTPRFGRTSAWTASTVNDITTLLTTAIHIHEEPWLLVTLASTRILYLKHVIAASTTTVNNRLVYLVGHHKK